MTVLYVLRECIADLRANFSGLTNSQKRLAATGALAGLVLCTYLLARALMLPSGPVLLAVRGTAVFEGKPIEAGTVVFEPEEGAEGQRRVAQITKGVFTLTKPEGLVRDGTYVMRVSAFQKTGSRYINANMGESLDAYEQIIPPSFNTNSTLTIKATRSAVATPVTLDLR